MFCRFGSVDDSRPVAAIVWLNVVWIRPSDADRVQQPVDGDLEPGDVAVRQQMLQERVAGLVEQRLQRIGVGGVAGLGALGLRHLQLVEQHDL